jgi:mRNA interferase YafQ
MYTVLRTKSFEKDLKKVSKHKNFKRKNLEDVIDILSSGKKIDSKYLNHKLHGDLGDCFDLHVQNDLVLIYKKDEEIKLIALLKIGSHSNLF